MDSATDNPPKACSLCGAVFACGASDPAGGCWCFDEAPLAWAAPGAPDCLCPACLAERLADRDGAGPVSPRP